LSRATSLAAEDADPVSAPSPLTPAILAVIPSWNARERLGEVLGGLERQVTGVIVVDNGSRDGTVEWLSRERPDVHLIANRENRGYAGAVNQGIVRALAAEVDAVLLVNDDAVFMPGAVSALARALARTPRAGATTARLLLGETPGTLNGAGGAWNPERAVVGLRGAFEPADGAYVEQATVDYPSGAAALLRSPAIEAVGLMDERFFLYHEDAEWGLRARERGWETLYVPEAVVVHAGWSGTRADPARRRYYNVRNRLLLARLYARPSGRCRAWWETALLLARQPLRWVFPKRRRDAEAVMAAVLDASAGRFGRSAIFG